MPNPGHDPKHGELRPGRDDIHHLAAADLDDLHPPSAEPRRRSRPGKRETQVSDREHRAFVGSRRSVQSMCCHGQTRKVRGCKTSGRAVRLCRRSANRKRSACLIIMSHTIRFPPWPFYFECLQQFDRNVVWTSHPLRQDQSNLKMNTLQNRFENTFVVRGSDVNRRNRQHASTRINRINKICILILWHSQGRNLLNSAYLTVPAESEVVSQSV